MFVLDKKIVLIKTKKEFLCCLCAMRAGAGSTNVRNKFMSSLLEHIIHNTDRATKSGALQTIPTNVVELLEKETGIKVRYNVMIR